ncbi:hypothetical protein EB796_022507 [Bugula neritina]|uniref:Uncharacterized protein n=1 Tax=Bugula neritina TaxID=10212 RepID=A0A7J7J0N6_BUGNE|nr:hypothetical protein EB796_022507 [Bugula neritina]
MLINKYYGNYKHMYAPSGTNQRCPIASSKLTLLAFKLVFMVDEQNYSGLEKCMLQVNIIILYYIIVIVSQQCFFKSAAKY